MDTLLYNKNIKNIEKLGRIKNKLLKKLEKYKQKGGEIIDFIPKEDAPIDLDEISLLKEDPANKAYYDLINYARLFDNKELKTFEQNHMTNTLGLFVERIQELEKIVNEMKQLDTEKIKITHSDGREMTHQDIDELKKSYTEYIEKFKKKVIDESLFELDPDKYPGVFYKEENQKQSIEEFNKSIKNIFHLFDSSKNPNKLDLKENKTLLNNILEECENFDRKIQFQIDEIEQFIRFDVSENIIIDKENIFLDTTQLNFKITEYDYKKKINYTDSIEDIFTKGDVFNNFIAKLESIIKFNSFDYGILKNPISDENIVEKVFYKLIEKKHSYNEFSISYILSEQYDIQTTLLQKNLSYITNKEVEELKQKDTREIPQNLETGITSGETKTKPIQELEKLSEKTQLGGVDIKRFMDNVIINEQTGKDLIEIIDLVDKVNKQIGDFKEKYNKLILTLKRMDLYNFYLKVLVYNSWDKQNYVVFKYINRGLCQYYFGILDDIVDKFNHLNSIQREVINKDGNPISNPTYIGIAYLNRYHYMTIMKLYNFFKGLLNIKEFTNSHIINIEHIDKYYGANILFYISMKDNFALFNNFKEILDSFRETLQNKVTIYARINDNKSYDDKIRMFIKNKENGRYLDINPTTCIPNKPNMVLRPQTIKFNEVFDFDLDTETISKYMTMASQITKGKGVVIMTYGYSGTGKTFTLFGKYDKIPKNRKQGILQSTLSNIIGVKKIFLRVYELYGKGSVYNDYWNDINGIDQSIFSYDIEVTEDKNGPTKNTEETQEKKNLQKSNKKITLKNNKNPIQIKNNLNDFFNENQEKTKDPHTKHGFTLISTNDDETHTIFQKFSDFTNEIDEKRKNGSYLDIDEKKVNELIPRITRTPNNPESSRSILFYEFYIQVENNIIPFIIIDLPGREEIISSYCDAHINKVQLYTKKSSVQSDKDFYQKLVLNEKLYQSMLSSYVLNPFGMELFYKSISQQNLNDYYNILDPTKLGINDNFKNLIQIKYKDENNIDEHFSYNLNMFEGIYINENIMGLTQVLIDIIKETKKDLNVPIIETQKASLHEVKKKLKEFSTKMYKQKPIPHNTKAIEYPDPDNKITTKSYLDESTLEELYRYNKQLYDSKKKYLDNDKIIIKPIIEKYNKNNKFICTHNEDLSKIQQLDIKKVDSYKLFYLVSNYLNPNEEEAKKIFQLKCSHQYELLENTLSLINAIRN